MSYHTAGKFLAGTILLLMVAMISGCFSQKAVHQPIFFPNSPKARIQYLTTISTAEDIGGKGVLSLLTGSESNKEEIKKPYGIAVIKDKIYVSDTSLQQIVTIDLKAKTFSPFNANLEKPINLAVDEDGAIYVADALRHAVLAFKPDGSPLPAVLEQDSQQAAQWITDKPEKPRAYSAGPDSKPTDVAVYGNEIYVIDNVKSVINVFDKGTAKLLRSIGQETAEEKDRLSLPTNLTVDGQGNIYATNIGSCFVNKYDREGKPMLSFGGIGTGFGKFVRPKGIAVDDEGLIYVVDAGFQNVQLFNPEGRLLIFFGDPGSREASLQMPAGVAVSRENIDYFKQYADPRFVIEKLIFVTNQTGSKKVSVFALGQRTDRDDPTPPPADAPKQTPAK